LLLSWNLSQSQEILKPADAVRITLENNYGIRLAQNATLIAENNTSRYNTGELPSVGLNSGVNYGIGGSEIAYNNETLPNASTWVSNGVDFNAVLSASYLLYDFKGRELNKERLQELLNSAQLEERRSMELNILATLASYYNIAKIQENLFAQEEVLAISRDRKERASYQFEYGKTNRLSVLNAEVDINRDSIDYLNLKQQLDNEKRDFNLLLGREIESEFEIDTSLSFEPLLTYEDLLAGAMNMNIDLLLIQKDIQLSELDSRINSSTLKPKLSANASLGVFGGLNDSKVSVKNQFASDFATGLTLSWNIFDGGYTKVREDNIKIALDNQQILLEQQKKQLTRDIKNAWESYKNQLYILEVETSNIETAEINFERTEEQFKLGRVSSVEFRQAQLNKLFAMINYNRAKFIAKVNELSLLQLSGKLVDGVVE
jgi:outer membrane protein TolC